VLRSPFREFCPKIRAQLGLVVERFLHGYDEEEVCYALSMCAGDMVQVWQPGAPTAAMANIMGMVGMGQDSKVLKGDQRA